MGNLLDKELCVVTGAANGIGRAIAQRFIREGADLIIADFDVDTAKEVFGNDSHVLDIVKIDATNEADLDKIADAVRQTGRKLKAVLPIVGNGPQNPIPAVTPLKLFLKEKTSVTMPLR